MEKTLKKHKEEKETSFLQRFIFWFFIPLLFAVFLGLLIASVNGVNVFEKAKEISEKIPIITDIKEGKENEKVVEYEDKIISLDAEIQDKNAQINQLKSQLDNKDLEKERLVVEQERLEQTIEELRQIQTENKRAFKEIVSTFESMTPKKAAPIILEMKEEEAIKILSNLNTASLAKVLEKMPPEKAATYSDLLAANTN
ncbi:MotE family protein [Lederbergia lenta]|uniref:MgtE intracellular region n=2 Tax=Lederbergia lenta TaxID=1467 RepID=A0A2X4WAS3_LEDLE|nr:MotE family protein [Lederbergia lenta]MCM3110151.1 MotE family protein [Lederbergia lenta]MEC2324280.1 MotE family protein [Lederbergia lenta]SQI60231.1 MgtE intracellular region [Lederbergia lenta]